MKLLRIIILLACLLPFNIFGQETLSSLDANWLKLTRPIMLRSETINSLIKQLHKHKEIPVKALNTLASLSNNIYINAKINAARDSTTISLLNDQNNKLMIALSRVYVFLDSSEKVAKNEKILEMRYRIEANENRIYFAKREYNEACKDLKRMDLKFGDLSDQPPEVKF